MNRSNTSVSGSFFKLLIVLLTIFISAIPEKILAQGITLSGVVRDINTHREISEVNIYIKNTRIGATSDFAGRYTVNISEADNQERVVFSHIAYEQLEFSIETIKTLTSVYLQPRVIPLQGVEVEGESEERFKIEQDLPQTISLIEARNFEIRGYVDAGDLLRTDHSIQVAEELSGKKTISIRGGNPEDVVVLYNGVKLNNNYDNVYDLSLIDLEDIKRFEIIKGSNTALYGPEAFSGVINIVPKLQQNYTMRFQQRLGTYRSGNWGLHLYRKFKRLLGSYSFKRGGLSRNFNDTNERLKNRSFHHTANLSYAVSETESGKPINSLRAMWVYTSLDYDNRRDRETIENLNHLFSLNYAGNISRFKDVELALSFRRLDEDQNLDNLGTLSGLQFDSINRTIKDRGLHLNTEKRFGFGRTNLLLGYQYQKAELDLDSTKTQILQNRTIHVNSFTDLERQHHGFVAIIKYNGATGSDFLDKLNVDLSLRHDRVQDDRSFFVMAEDNTVNSTETVLSENNWNDTMFKFSMSAHGYRRDLTFFGFFNFGKNTKFPTLLQQESLPRATAPGATTPNLSPEKISSLEVGAVITREIQEYINVDGWQLSLNFFQNHYDNKFRTFSRVGSPRLEYDNVKNASISGFEGKTSVFLFRKKITFELGLSKYFISEKSAFPFKSDFKRTTNLIVDHAGYSFQIHWFTESEQVGLLLDQNDQLVPITLQNETNLDLHLSKTFGLDKLKIFVNASGRNLLNGDEDLLGLAIRDRRFYLTLGAQY